MYVVPPLLVQCPLHKHNTQEVKGRRIQDMVPCTIKEKIFNHLFLITRFEHIQLYSNGRKCNDGEKILVS